MAKMACAQCGGAKMKKMANGGPFGKGNVPLYDNNPRTQQGRMLKNGGIKKAAYGMAMDSLPMTKTTVAKPKRPRVGKVTDKARVGMVITNAPVKKSPPVGKRHNASHTGFESVSQKRKGGMTKTLKKAQDGKNVKEGPLTEKDAKMLSTSPLYKDTNKAYRYFSSGMQPTPSGYRVTPQSMKNDKEKEIRSSANFKRGGITKKKMSRGGMTKRK